MKNIKNKNIVRLRKFEKKLCPSGGWDNGLYQLTDLYLEIPAELFVNAIIEDFHVDTSYAVPGKNVLAKRITVGASHWIVQNDPKIFD